MLGFVKLNVFRLTLSCSGRIHKRFVSVLLCAVPIRHPFMYRMKFDSLSAVVTKKKRGRFLMFSTSIIQRENTTASNSQEIPALTSPSQRVVFLAEQLMTKDAGSFEYPKDYHAAYELLSEIVGDANSSSKAINVSVFLLERAVREYSHYLALHVKDMQNTNKSSESESWWFCNPLVVSSVFNLWKDAAIRNEDVLSPREMVQKLQNMSVLLPERFRYNIPTMNIIMHVLIRKEPLHRAPFVAENLFDFIAAESAARAVHGDSSMQPTSHTYSMVLHAWSQSRLSNAAAKIEQIMATLHKEYCANPELIAAGELVPYAIWIRYWSNLGNAEKVDSILALLDGNEHLHARVRGNILSHAIYCYTKVGQIKKAELIYDRMISLGPPTTWATNSADSNNIFDDDERRGLMLGSFYLINYYRQVIVALIGNSRVIPQRCEVQIHQFSERAEAVLRQVEEFREIDPESVDKMRKTLMDIYALSKRFNLVETMFYGMDHPSTEAHNILIKAYGKIQQPEKAEEVVQRMLENPFSAQPRIETINSLLNAWAEATNNPQVADRAYKIFRWISDDSRFAELKIRPNVITYSTVLKCWATFGYRHPKTTHRISEKVEAFLKELEERYNSGDTTCKPDAQLYSMAIKAYLSVGNVVRAEALLQRMEKTPEIKPTVRTFSEFLLYYAQLGNAEGAQWAEELLDRLRTMSDSSVRPNSYTFNIVLNAWAKLGSPDAADRMWNVYEKRLADNVELDHVCLGIMTKILSFSKRPIDVKKCLLVLRAVNDSKQIQVSNRVYSSVLKGCMTLNDNDTAAHVLTLLIEACVSGRCRLDDPPDRAKFNWIITKWLAHNHLVKASTFLEGLLRLTANRRGMNDLVGLGPDLSTVLDLRKAWTVSSHPEKADYVAKLDVEIIPTIVRTLNIEKGNVQR